MTDPLQSYRWAWNAKPLLRRIYHDFYDRIESACVPGPSVEIGGGIGEFKRRFPNVVSTDIQAAPGLDVVADAQRLPFASGSISNIIMVDVLHHIEFPLLFLREAERVLAPGGRCVMVEPAITWGSTLFYRLFHPERVAMGEDPFAEGSPDVKRDPYESNQAIPTLLVVREQARLKKHLPTMSVVRSDWFSFAAYPLSGGFTRWSLLPDWAGRGLLALERKLEFFVGRALAFRLFIVIEKEATSAHGDVSP